jgi:signal transduction histidine kinase/ligand-binding sensor domain-containing protein/DNA-binding response OmpR family regulator
VGTNVGLNKYDGYGFENFRYEIDDKTSLRSSFIQNLTNDDEGNLWVSTFEGGINIFDSEKYLFREFGKKSGLDSIMSHVSYVHQAIDGTFWIGSLRGLVHYYPETRKYDIFHNHPSEPNSISNNRTVKIVERFDGTIMVLGYNGILNIYNPNDKNFTRHKVRDISKGSEVIPITHIFEDSNHTLLVGTTNGLYIFDQTTGEFRNAIPERKTKELFSANQINDILEYTPGVIWIATKMNGIVELVWDRKDELQYIATNSPNAMPGKWVNKLYKDRQGNVWMGTEHDGVKVVFNKKKQFFSVSLRSERVQAITKDSKNKLWLGTVNGLYRYNMKTKKQKRYTTKSGLSDNNIRSLLVDDNRLLVGTERGLNILDLKTGKISIRKDENGILSAPIVVIKKDKKGNYWLGSGRKGLIHIEKESGNISNYYGPVVNNIVGNSNVASICFDSEERLWVGIYGGGLNLFDTKKREFTEWYLNDVQEEKSISVNKVIDIFQSKNNNLWIATKDGGLNLFNQETSEFKTYLKKDGLPSNNIYGIVEDKRGDLWLSTDKGLVRFEPKTGRMKYFDSSDGMLSNLFYPKAKFMDAEGQIYFGTFNGITYFKPEEINENVEEPTLLFTGFSIFNKEVEINGKDSPLKKHISNTDSIVLRYDQTAITIDYVGLNFISSKKNRYAYMMEGLEKDWREVEGQRSANYSNLPPGEYRFLVKASNNDDVWTKEPLELYIKVLPPFWRSNMGYAIYIILFVGLNILIIWFVRWLARRKHDLELVQVERDKEKQLSQFKLQFFTNISHELRTHLTLIVYPINKLLNKKVKPGEINKELGRIDLNAKRLLKLTDEIIDFRKVEQGKAELSLQTINIVEFLNDIQQLFNPIAEKHGISFVFTPNRSEIDWCFDQEKLKKVVFNLLSNAFKYTPDGGGINFYARFIDNSELQGKSKLVIGVEDNGIGIDKENLPHIFDRFFNPGKHKQQHDLHDSSGIGLALVKQLVELHGGKIFVESEEGKGSHFYLELVQLDEPKNDSSLDIPAMTSGREVYEKWEEMLDVERSNIQDQLVVTEKIESDGLPVILIVDDNREICETLNEILKEKYRVNIAVNGKQALETVEKVNIDIVISDIMMPVMDGIEFCNELKGNIKTSHIPVILLTAKSGEENELTGLRAGADAYITKPFNYEKVQLTVENILQSRKRVRELLKGKENGELLEQSINPLDKKLIDKIVRIITQKLSDTDFTVDSLRREVGLSRMHLYRKMKALTGYSPSDMIVKARLEKSKDLIQEGELTISEIAYETGYSSPGNFSTAFKKFFEQTPAQYRNKCFK